ncbi:ParB/RepB/Spo0J family partition protein [Streptomyces sp. 4.24]|uniref:ParB/RepB/Spo0J family partition protein n=1 Tax=Streptomyces tritrimontium TaxID=3406573 RepID=UPI003BB59FB5
MPQIQTGPPTARLDELMPSPENGRKELLKVEELAALLRSDGMNTAMTVIPPEVFLKRFPQHTEAVGKAVASGVRWIVHHGHRRLAAAKLVPLLKVPVLIRDDVPNLRIAQIQENLGRMGLSPLEEGEEFSVALSEVDEVTGKAFTQRSLAERVGASQTYIAHRVALLRLIPDLQAAVVRHWRKEQGVKPEGEDAAGEGEAVAEPLLLAIRTGATICARLTKDLQNAVAERELSVDDAAVVCKLREELQDRFYVGDLSLEAAAELAKLPQAKQVMPTVQQIPATPPVPAPPAPTPTPPVAVPPAPPAPPVPSPRDETTPTDTPAPADQAQAGPETTPAPPAATPVGAAGSGQPPTAPNNAADTPGTQAASSGEVATLTPRVIEIGAQEGVEQLVLALIDALTDEERDYVRDQLA